MAQDSMNSRIWEKVSTTDEKYVKAFSRKGGFRGTAINATWLARQATKVFGPCGIGWGMKVVDEQYVSGADGDIVHVIRVQLWYVFDGVHGEIEQYGQTIMVGTDKNGKFTDEEAPKKSMTDAMSKCLSLLGFGADVHLGLWDDNKYVSERKRESGSSDAPVVSDAEYAAARDVLDSCQTVESLRASFSSMSKPLQGMLTEHAKGLSEKLKKETAA